MRRMYTVVKPNNYYCSTKFHSIIKCKHKCQQTDCTIQKTIQTNVNLHIISLHKDLKTTRKYVFYLLILHTIDEYATSLKKGVKTPRSCNLFAGKL